MKLTKGACIGLIVGSLAVFALYVVVAHFEFVATNHQVCQQGIDQKELECGPRGFLAFAGLLFLRLLDAYNGLIQGLAAIAVVGFTYFLMRIAKEQAEISSKQAVLMEQQLAIMEKGYNASYTANTDILNRMEEQLKIAREQSTSAEQAAHAARDSADAFMVSERPILALESLRINGLNQNPDGVLYDDDEVVHSHWQLKNYGKCPARIVDLSAKLMIAAALPQTPTWGTLKQQDWLEIVSPGSDIRHFSFLPSNDPEYPDWNGSVGPEQSQKLESRELKIFLCIRVRYLDQFEKLHTVSGAWQGVFENDAYNSTRWGLAPCGPKSYWEYA